MVRILDHDIRNYRRALVLLDGRKVLLRPIRCDDKNRLIEFHTHLSEDTLFSRYQYSKGDLTEEDLKNFCEIDYNNSLALVAETGSGRQRKIIGVGRYYRLKRYDTAEVAFVVRDCDQRKGIGTQLLKHLAILARQKDVKYFIAGVLKLNGKMMSIFRKADPGIETIEQDDTTITIKLSVAEVIRNLKSGLNIGLSFKTSDIKFLNTIRSEN
jgi:hypothetical protein